MRVRPVEPGDTEAIADVFVSALATMTYLPELHTEAETRTFVRDVLLPNNEIWVAELIASPLWLQRFQFGPLEWLWRSLTYCRRQPFRN